jgi:fibronectin-binding autotransporter adhesin
LQKTSFKVTANPMKTNYVVGEAIGKLSVSSRHPRAAGAFRRFVVATTLSCVALAAVPAARAGTDTWNGAGADNNWTTGLNWGGTAPSAQDSLFFGGSTRLGPVNNYATATQFNGIGFNSNAGAFTLTGNAINLGGNVTSATATAQTINIGLNLLQDTTFSGGSIIVNGAISGNFSLISGSSLTLKGTNGYTGTTTINSGSFIQVGSGTASGTVGSGSVIDNGNLYLSRSDTNTFANSISGGGAVNMFSSGNTTLTGGNGYTGATNLIGTGGTLTAGATNVLGSGSAINVSTSGSGSTLAIGAFNQAVGAVTLGTASVSGTITGSTGVLSGTSYSLLSGTVSAILGGAGAVTKTAGGTVTLSASNTYAGGTTVSGGTLASSSTGQNGALSTGTVTVSTGGTLRSNNQDSFGYTTGAPSAININGGTVTTAAGGAVGSGGFRTTLQTVNLTGGTLTSAGTNAGDGFGVFSFNGNVTTIASSTSSVISATSVALQSNPTFTVAAGTVPGSVDLLVSSKIINYSGANSLTKAGNGLMSLTGANTYSGGTTVDAGTLALNSTGADGTGALSVNGSTVTVGATNALGAGAVTLTGGTLKSTTTTTSQSGLGSLTLGAGASTLDFGAGNTSGLFSFSSSSANAFTGTLNILDWNGTSYTGGGADRFFVGTTSSGLTTTQLSSITFTNPNGISGVYQAIQLANGEVVAADSTPEPTDLALMLSGALVGGMAFLRRRAAERP